MTLSDGEVELVLAHRAKIRSDKYEEMVMKKRAECDHEYKFLFQNYKTYYYKCKKCGQESVR